MITVSEPVAMMVTTFQQDSAELSIRIGQPYRSRLLRGSRRSNLRHTIGIAFIDDRQLELSRFRAAHRLNGLVIA
ncbi:MAG: hypothetical protein CBB71_02990 [Rhodopirellula sp. TMED11]|nr:MAG: hypothetical protein CBB71_02990 [Rhodopirellula sp. TMED11]